MVSAIRTRLMASGVSCWFDEVDLPKGVDWMSRIEAALQQSDSCVIFYGPSGIGPWHEIERQLAQLMAAETWRGGRHFGIIPVRLPDAPQWKDLALPPFLRLYTSIEFKSLTDYDAHNELAAAILQERRPAPVEIDDKRPPFIGMLPFTENDTSIFTGRYNYILDLEARLRRPRGARFIAVLGASGSGKSSLLQAGLLPHLRQGIVHPETREWIYVTMRPGGNALGNLEANLRSHEILRPHVPAPVEKMEERRANWPEERLHEIATTALGNGHGGPRMVLIVDQFEELFTLMPSDDKRRKEYVTSIWEPFLKNLAYAAREESGRVSVIISMRSDFLPQFAGDESLKSFLGGIDHRCLIHPLNAREVRASIEHPAAARNIQLERTLVEVVVQDYQLDPVGALPFLQEALRRVWEMGGRRDLTYANYEKIDGLRGAVNAQANEVLRKFRESKGEDEIAMGKLIEPLFIHLTRLADDGGPDTKRRRRLSDLPGGELAQKLARELASTDYRLIVVDQLQAAAGVPANPGDGEGKVDSTAEIAHESLLKGWTDLHQWLNGKDRPKRLQLRRFETEARVWDEEGDDHQPLLRGLDLHRAERLCRTFAAEVPAVLGRFVKASRSASNFRLLRNGGIAAAAVALLVVAYLYGRPPMIEDPLAKQKQELEVLAGQAPFPAPDIIVKAGEIARHEKGKDYGRAWALWGRGLVQQKRYDDAKNIIAQWLENVPGDMARIKELGGDVAKAEGHSGEAINHWLEAESKHLPDEKLGVWKKLAKTYGTEGRWDEGAAWVDKWVAGKDELEARLLRYEGYHRRAKWREAKAELDYLRGRFRTSPRLRDLPPVPSGRLQGRIYDVTEQVRYRGHDALLYIERARLYIEAGALAEAYEDLLRVQDIDSGHEGFQPAVADLKQAFQKAKRMMPAGLKPPDRTQSQSTPGP